MFNSYKKFTEDGIVLEGKEIEETLNVPDKVIPIIPTILKKAKRMYLLEDSTESLETMEELEKEWECNNGELIGSYSLTLDFVNTDGCRIKIRYSLCSGSYAIKFINEVGAVSFGLAEL
jgi:hypothetical protein